MKKALVVIWAVCILCSFSGCAVLDQALESIQPEEKIFFIDDYQLKITADSTFHQDTQGSFDLQITNNKAYISFMTYQYIDLPEGVTPMNVYETQNNDLLSKRDNAVLIEESKSQTTSQYNLTNSLYSGEKDGTKYYYASYLIDFPNDETFAWVIVSAAPSYFSSNRDYLHRIVCSLEVTK